MTLRISPRLLLVAAILAAVALAAYRVGAVTSARPVVMEKVVRADPRKILHASASVNAGNSIF